MKKNEFIKEHIVDVAKTLLLSPGTNYLMCKHMLPPYRDSSLTERMKPEETNMREALYGIYSPQVAEDAHELLSEIYELIYDPREAEASDGQQ